MHTFIEQRGVKRKAAPPPASDTDESPQPKETGTMKGKVKEKETTPLDVKLRKNRIVSDNEDEDMKDAPRWKPLVKGRTKASAAQSILETPAERSLRAMMDIDDCGCTFKSLCASFDMWLQHKSKGLP